MTGVLGRSDVRVPPMGVGVMVWGDQTAMPRWDPARNAYGPNSSLADQREALAVCLSAGVNLVDTAAMYGGGASELRVGELAGPDVPAGSDVLVATKFPARFLSGAGSLPATLDASLARLRRTSVDLYQVHYPVPWMSIGKLMDLMAEAVAAGKVRAVGVSNFSALQMRTAHAALARHGLPLASNQVQYSLLHRDPETNGVLAACRELGVTLIAYMPLASGALTGKYSAVDRPSGWRRWRAPFRKKDMPRVERVNAVQRELAGRYGRTPSQIALRWLLQQPGVLPIPGAKNARQARENVGALEFELTPADLEALSAVSA
ncbi:aldo/keto reductase [Saccharothrix variisporea]|uniref:aldo/keto reductase n=1 Tax=Saccharothrix variisporea TaxID=543527 RepID=UPI001476E657|nr:aldo/keto reductase [Saccharothrix variisporea]